MSDGVDLVLRAAGVLVALGGLVVLTLLSVERFAERVLDAFGAAVDGDMATPRLALAVVALTTVASGLALAALHRAAPGLMLAAAAGQALWRMALKRWLPEAADAATGGGREAVRVALMAFLVLAAGVLIVDWRRPDIWRAESDVWLVVAVALIALAALFRTMSRRRREGD